MNRTKLILAGLLAGAVVTGTACKSDKAAEGATQPQATPDAGTGGGGFQDLYGEDIGQEPGDIRDEDEIEGTGGAGEWDTSEPLDDPMEQPPREGLGEGEGTGGTGDVEPVEPMDPMEEPMEPAPDGMGEGTGGAGFDFEDEPGEDEDPLYDENEDLFEEREDLGGDSFPTDDIVPQ